MSSLFFNSIFSTTIIVVMDAEVSQKKQDLQRLTIYILPNSVICLTIWALPNPKIQNTSILLHTLPNR